MTIKNNVSSDTETTTRVPREKGTTDQLKPFLADAEDRQEALIDEAVEESMDASDPPSPKHIT